MGTSMPDDRAYALPHDGRLVMINVEKSRVDAQTNLIIRESPEKVMDLLLRKLNFQKLPWKRYYRLRVGLSEDSKSIEYSAVDPSGINHYILKNIKVTGVTTQA